MRFSQAFVPTLREVPSEAEIASHQLMLRAGLMRKLASGVYSFLPMGYRSLRKIENIIREEMDRAGAQELIMSAILPSEAYLASGRWDVFGPEMFRLKDRNDRDFCLGPTHEEIFTDTVKSGIKSYKGLPITLYQIQTKYRDERRPRFGVIRSREFVMKDAYSFDTSEEGLDISYQKMKDAYYRIFERCGLDFIPVDADSGAMGGSGSQEFMVKSEIGEDVIAYCDSCNYAANDEKAECVVSSDADTSPMQEVEKVATPDAKTIDDLTKFFDCSEKVFVKTLLYNADGKIIAVLVRGDREVNEVKLKNLLVCNELELASFEDVEKVTGAAVGFAGPVGLDVDIYADREVAIMRNFVTGANDTGYHLKNVNIDRDFKVTKVADLRHIEQGDKCPVCGQPIQIAHGIEVGHIFKLGTKYTKALDCKYIDEDGKEQYMIMGCYGIGVNRTMAAVIEQCHDENGIIWPMSVAPYHVTVVPVKVKDETQMNLAEEIYSKLLDNGIEAIIDDRDERPGVKFKDNDLIGIPLRITVGKRAEEGIVEFKERSSSEVTELTVEEAIQKVIEKVNE